MEEVKKIGFFRSLEELVKALFGNGQPADEVEIDEWTKSPVLNELGPDGVKILSRAQINVGRLAGVCPTVSSKTNAYNPEHRGNNNEVNKKEFKKADKEIGEL